MNLFPYQVIRGFITQYIESHGKPPKLLVVNPDDLFDWKVSCTIAQAKGLLDIAPDLQITYGDYLERGQMDLAIGICNDSMEEQSKVSDVG